MVMEYLPLVLLAVFSFTLGWAFHGIHETLEKDEN